MKPFFRVWVPSKGEYRRCGYLTTSQQKAVVMSQDLGDLEFYLTMGDVLAELVEGSVEDFTILDQFSILTLVRINSIGGTLPLESGEVDIIGFFESMGDLLERNFSNVVRTEGMEIHCGVPSMDAYRDLLRIRSEIGGKGGKEGVRRYIDERMMCMIHRIVIDGQSCEFSKLELGEKVTVMKGMPAKAYPEINRQFVDHLNDHLSYDGLVPDDDDSFSFSMETHLDSLRLFFLDSLEAIHIDLQFICAQSKIQPEYFDDKPVLERIMFRERLVEDLKKRSETQQQSDEFGMEEDDLRDITEEFP